jgi:hypothetical protein
VAVSPGRSDTLQALGSQANDVVPEGVVKVHVADVKVLVASALRVGAAWLVAVIVTTLAATTHRK